MKEYSVKVLLSCMHQDNWSILEKSNLMNSNVLVVNQCDVTEQKNL